MTYVKCQCSFPVESNYRRNGSVRIDNMLAELKNTQWCTSGFVLKDTNSIQRATMSALIGLDVAYCVHFNFLEFAFSPSSLFMCKSIYFLSSHGRKKKRKLVANLLTEIYFFLRSNFKLISVFQTTFLNQRGMLRFYFLYHLAFISFV